MFYSGTKLRCISSTLNKAETSKKRPFKEMTKRHVVFSNSCFRDWTPFDGQKFQNPERPVIELWQQTNHNYRPWEDLWTDRQYLLLSGSFTGARPEATKSPLFKQRDFLDSFLGSILTAWCRLARRRQHVQRTCASFLWRHRHWCQVQLQTTCTYKIEI